MNYFLKKSRPNFFGFVYILVLILLGTSQANAAVNDSTGDLLTYVSTFVASIPRAYSTTLVNSYDVPTPTEVSGMVAVIDAIKTGNLDQASTLALSYNYEVTRYTDTATGKMSVLLSEIRNSNGTWPHAWGMYIYSPSSTNSYVVEVPHPVFDFKTEDAGVFAFRRANARALTVAGSHRYANQDSSSDVSHFQGSVFEAIHEHLITPSSTVYQPHGYNKNNYTTTTPPDAVISSGVSSPSPVVSLINTNLHTAGFNTCAFAGDLDGSSSESINPCYELGATTNVQGIYARSIGAEFIHGEMEYAIRNSSSLLNQLVNSLVDSSITQTLPDTIAPTVPTSLLATVISSSQINLSWTASTDNVSVTGYKIFHGGVQIATSSANSYSNTGLTAGTAYTYTVSAYDAAGNNSTQTAGVSATTQATLTYTITVTQGTDGTITPGTTSVTSGSNQTFTITPNSGYQIASVTVDGTTVETVSTYSTCTFTNVTASHTITAVFRSITAVNKFVIGDRVQTTAKVNVRSTASITGKLIGQQKTGVLGTVIAGPQTNSGYTWWKIDFDSGADGWVAGGYLVKIISAAKIALAPSATPKFTRQMAIGAQGEDVFLPQPSSLSTIVSILRKS